MQVQNNEATLLIEYIILRLGASSLCCTIMVLLLAVLRGADANFDMPEVCSVTVIDPFLCIDVKCISPWNSGEALRLTS